MSTWTRLRPGKRPMFNRALCDFPNRARYLRLAREIRIVLARPDDWVPPLLHSLARAAQKQAQLGGYDPRLDELPF
jgi:hypothetical protein